VENSKSNKLVRAEASCNLRKTEFTPWSAIQPK